MLSLALMTYKLKAPAMWNLWDCDNAVLGADHVKVNDRFTLGTCDRPAAIGIVRRHNGQLIRSARNQQHISPDNAARSDFQTARPPLRFR
jgi:hypothetical protein